MRNQKKGVPTRTVVAIALIFASFISSFALSRAANQTELLWSARSVLIPGSKIIANDLALRRVALPDGDAAYAQQDINIVGLQVLRAIGAGELIPISALNKGSSGVANSDVPISVQNSDTPIGLESGEIVNLYHVSDPRLSTKIGPPILVLSHIYIYGIDQKSQSLSGNLSLTLSVPKNEVVRLLTATDSGRIVVVRVNG